MKQQIIGQKIRNIREKYGLSQEEVEKSLDLPKKAMTRIESGQRSVSSLELAQLAELLFCSIADFFPEKEGVEEDVLVTLYRLSPGLEADLAVQKEVAKYVQICREGVFLEELLNRASRKRILSYPFFRPASVLEAIRQGDQVAKEERKRLGLGNRPIHDIVDLLSSQGIWCAGTELPVEMAGLFLFRPSIGVAILINGRHAQARRSSYAHEYAHALLDQNQHVLISTTANASEFIETRANAFAAAFLLPSEGVSEMIHSLGKGGASRTDYEIFDVATQGVVETEERLLASRQKITPQDIALIAHHFGVSYQATVYRLRSLRYLSQKEREQLLHAELQGKGYLKMLGLNDLDKSEKNSVDQRELKTYISQLMIEAYQSGKISRGRLFELSRLLSLPGQQILEIAEGLK